MTHVVAGYPSIAGTVQLVKVMEKVGVDFIEIQIPFSDPIADGPLIMKANDIALMNGMNTEKAFVLVEQLSKKVKIPLLIMGYYNTVFQYGVKKFCEKARKVGARAVIIPDIPVDEEEKEHFIRYCNRCKCPAIRVLSPTSTDERIAINLQVASEFVYCTAVAGTTGVRNELNQNTQNFLKRIKTHTDLPLAVGFGISKPEHVKMLVGYADIAVVGSAVIQIIEEKGIDAVGNYLRSLLEKPL